MTNESFRLIARSAIAASAVLLLGACTMTIAPPPGGAWPPPSGPATWPEPPTPPPTPTTDCQFAIATVTEAQGDAFIIRPGSPAPRRAAPGDRLCNGDSFRTGAGTMKLRTDQGTMIDVYEFTDPRIFKEAACFAISFFDRGKLDIWGEGVCVNGVLKQSSRVGYQAMGGQLRVWVVEGRVRTLRPPFTTISTNQHALVRNGRVVSVRPFSPAEFNRVFPKARLPEQQEPVILR